MIGAPRRATLGREEWRDTFQAMFEEHLGEPCAAAGITLDGLARAIGDQHAAVVFGCVVEDFAAADFEGGRNVIDDYLDGDEIAFTTVRYPLKPAVDRTALEASLGAIAGFRRDDEALWTWSAPAPDRPGNGPEEAKVLVSTFEDGSVSMGHVELEADASCWRRARRRAQKGRALLEPIIGRFVGEPVVKSQTMEELRASQPADRAPPRPPGLSSEEESGIVQAMLERHYRGLIDEPVPMLGNVSPREAAKTEQGREKLVGWLKLLENSMAQERAGSPMAGYDMTWMWQELGVAHLRR